MKTYNELYINTRNTLKRSGVEAYALEARVLVASAAGKTVPQLLRDLSLYTTEPVEEKVAEYTERRLLGEPVAYITGDWEFYGLPIKVTKDVLIPRSDTELLVDLAKEALTGWRMDARVLDLCCGSGCITCAIGHELPATKLVAVDLSASALEVCRANVNLNRLTTRVICMQADATSSPPLGIGSFDLIVSNPPYIESGEILMEGRDLTKLSIKEIQQIRGNDISVIFQEPMTSLNPVFSVDRQLSEPFMIHQDARGADRAVVGRM